VAVVLDSGPCATSEKKKKPIQKPKNPIRLPPENALARLAQVRQNVSQPPNILQRQAHFQRPGQAGAAPSAAVSFGRPSSLLCLVASLTRGSRAHRGAKGWLLPILLILHVLANQARPPPSRRTLT
jgi:hypothetical protein